MIILNSMAAICFKHIRSRATKDFGNAPKSEKNQKICLEHFTGKQLLWYQVLISLLSIKGSSSKVQVVHKHGWGEVARTLCITVFLFFLQRWCVLFLHFTHSNFFLLSRSDMSCCANKHIVLVDLNDHAISQRSEHGA